MSESQLQKLESSIQSLRKDVPFGNQVRKASEACNEYYFINFFLVLPTKLIPYCFFLFFLNFHSLHSIKQFLQQHEEVMLQGKNGPEPNPWLAKNSGCPVL